jgi:hypothetical protein
MLKISVIENGNSAAVREAKSLTKHKLLAEPEATEVLDHLAPDWPLHLYDGAVIDHILKVINNPRTSRTEITRRYRARHAASDLAEGEAARKAIQRGIQGPGGDCAMTTGAADEWPQNRPLTHED